MTVATSQRYCSQIWVVVEVVAEIATEVAAEVISRTELEPDYGSGNL